MPNSKHIAGLVGSILIVITISEALNAHIWIDVPATQTYLAGALWFLAGLAIGNKLAVALLEQRICS
jgi:hypothetical protein